MDTISMASTVALRTRSASPFVVPSGAQAFWHLGARSADMRLGIAPTSTPASNPMVVPNPRTTAKQARPPRGVPR